MRRRSCPARGSRGSIPAARVEATINSIHHQAVKELGRDLVVEAGRSPTHRRSDPLARAELRVRRPVASRVPCSAGRSARSSTTRRSSTIPRTPRAHKSAAYALYEARMKIINPATGARCCDDRRRRTPKAVRAKYERARAAQPRWAATPIRKRLAAIAQVPRAAGRAPGRDARAHADAGSRQADPPVAQRAERPARRGIDFFLAEIGARAARREGASPTPQQQDARSASRTSRSASSPTSRRGTIRISSAATCSCRRSPRATRCSTSRRSSRR